MCTNSHTHTLTRTHVRTTTLEQAAAVAAAACGLQLPTQPAQEDEQRTNSPAHPRLSPTAPTHLESNPIHHLPPSLRPKNVCWPTTNVDISSNFCCQRRLQPARSLAANSPPHVVRESFIVPKKKLKSDLKCTVVVINVFITNLLIFLEHGGEKICFWKGCLCWVFMNNRARSPSVLGNLLAKRGLCQWCFTKMRKKYTKSRKKEKNIKNKLTPAFPKSWPVVLN